MAMTEGAVVNILLNTPGGPAAGGLAGGAPDAAGSVPKGRGAKEKEGGADKDPGTEATQKGFKQLRGYLKGASKFFKNNVGLNFGLSSMLKQSQIFTSFIGVIFQLLGALVDVMLAPLIPIFFPVVRLMASWIPWLQNFMKGVYAWIGKTLDTILGWYDKAEQFISTEITSLMTAWKAGPKDFALAIWGYVETGIGWIWNKIINTAAPWMWDQIKGLWGTVLTFLSSGFGRLFGFFVQAYIMLGFVKSTVDNVFSFVVKWIPKSLAFIGRGLLQLLVWGIKAIPKIAGVMWKIVSFMLKTFFPGFGHVTVAIANAMGRLILRLPEIMTSIAKIVKSQIDGLISNVWGGTSVIRARLGMEVGKVTGKISSTWKLVRTFLGGEFLTLGGKVTWLKTFFQELPGKVWWYIGRGISIVYTTARDWLSERIGGSIATVQKWVGLHILDPIMKGVNGVKTFLGELVGGIFGLVRDKLKDVPFLGGKLEELAISAEKTINKLAPTLSDDVAKFVGGKMGIRTALRGLAIGSKVIPGFGAIATGAFGAIETYHNFRDYGWEVGVATGAKTILATLATGFGFVPAGLALDIGGTVGAELWKRSIREDRKSEGLHPITGKPSSMYGPDAADREAVTKAWTPTSSMLVANEGITSATVSNWAKNFYRQPQHDQITDEQQPMLTSATVSNWVKNLTPPQQSMLTSATVSNWVKNLNPQQQSMVASAVPQLTVAQQPLTTSGQMTGTPISSTDIAKMFKPIDPIAAPDVLKIPPEIIKLGDVVPDVAAELLDLNKALNKLPVAPTPPSDLVASKQIENELWANKIFADSVETNKALADDLHIAMTKFNVPTPSPDIDAAQSWGSMAASFNSTSSDFEGFVNDAKRTLELERKVFSNLDNTLINLTKVTTATAKSGLLAQPWENSVNIKIETQNGTTLWEDSLEQQHDDNEYYVDLRTALQGA